MTKLETVMRCRRVHRYLRWLSGIEERDPIPDKLSSWWPRVVRDEAAPLFGSLPACPVSVDEARETIRCFRALPAELMETMIQSYVVCGSREEQARAQRVSTRTVRRRVARAHALLARMFDGESTPRAPAAATERTSP